MTRVKLALLAAISIALAFTLSCSGDPGKDGIDGTNGTNGTNGTDGTSCEITPLVDADNDFEIFCGGVSVGFLNNGTDGKDGTNGTNGTSCEVKASTTAGNDFDILCGGEFVGFLNNGAKGDIGDTGDKGDTGAGCAVAPDPADSAYLVMTCGVGDAATTEKWAKAMCGTLAYDPAKWECRRGRLAAFIDSRDGQSYPVVTIGTQTWMAKNLNWAGTNSDLGACYGNDPDNCAKYGRLYDWATAMAATESSTSNPSDVQGVCPAGWHLPSNAEWDALYRFVDGNTGTSSPYDSPTAGRYLKSKDGWTDCGPDKTYACEDTYGFSALPGGFGGGVNFGDAGLSGNWWSATEYNASGAYFRDMYYSSEGAIWDSYDKSFLLSVRCVKDSP
ncbi:MAG: hypothetical protein LBU89_09850 [Fibromonadaceae bacterium]|jgi:uncharacterized protein (TIGR02145 family)|nr:hypothetical protein [Fibromonadaceae bacterium]